jgi:hypothetical protein
LRALRAAKHAAADAAAERLVAASSTPLVAKSSWCAKRTCEHAHMHTG